MQLKTRMRSRMHMELTQTRLLFRTRTKLVQNMYNLNLRAQFTLFCRINMMTRKRMLYKQNLFIFYY